MTPEQKLLRAIYGLPIYVQPPCKPDKEVFRGYAPEDADESDLARIARIPPEHIVDAKIIRSKKRGDRWSVVANVRFRTIN